jgi:hypothetical protein
VHNRLGLRGQVAQLFELDITSISAIIAAIGVIVGVVLTVQELRHLVKQRQTDLLVRISPWLSMNSSELQAAVVRTLNLEFKDYDDFVKRYGKIHSEKPEQTAFLAAVNYLEALGILAKRKLVDADLIYEFWTGDIPDVWEKIKPLVEGIRKASNFPILVNAEYLYNEMKKREQKPQAKKS